MIIGDETNRHCGSASERETRVEGNTLNNARHATPSHLSIVPTWSGQLWKKHWQLFYL